ncbi:Os12g0633501 [Oryza sativa Japonica Group]|uniref:Os12g0633501 protein n=1 Tax=Oryza sativa subsp. japonica TaxID=39947 RepID=A0A0P0YCS2_ORYSJ|nr:hypothetical protein EE612_061112 [Oryza sativa]BAT18233.1 Os12g0633501 [Oryza sativa Japonica Group]
MDGGGRRAAAVVHPAARHRRQLDGLRRCGKSCRLRWLNYLRPGIRHGAFSDHDDRLILALHAAVGTRPVLLLAAHQLHVASTSSGGMHVGVGEEGRGYDDVFAAGHSL